MDNKFDTSSSLSVESEGIQCTVYFVNKYSSTDWSSFSVLLWIFFLMWEHSGVDRIHTKLKGIKRTNYSKKMKEPILEYATEKVII